MTVTKKTRSTRSRKSKIAIAIAKHDNVCVRLMATFIESAMRHLENGDIKRAAAALRCAGDYEKEMPFEVKNGQTIEQFITELANG